MAINDVWPFILGATNQTIRMDYDGSGNNVYIGWATPGTASSADGWRLMRQTFNGTGQMTIIEWPNASTAFTFIWDNRALYSYS